MDIYTALQFSRACSAICNKTCALKFVVQKLVIIHGYIVLQGLKFAYLVVDKIQIQWDDLRLPPWADLSSLDSSFYRFIYHSTSR